MNRSKETNKVDTSSGPAENTSNGPGGNTSNGPGEISHGRRRFLGVAGATALAAGAAQLGMIGSAKAQTTATSSAGLAAADAGTGYSFGPVRQINAGVLNVGYVETGPANGRPVILLHGFPYDIHSYVEVAPLLAARGYRVIVPYFRGYGTTTFLSARGTSTRSRSPWTSWP
jgi:hypothetical protein